MRESKSSILLKLLRYSKASEEKYRTGDFKGAIEDKKTINLILSSSICDKDTEEVFKKELAKIYFSRFDLINDYKKKLDKKKKRAIISL